MKNYLFVVFVAAFTTNSIAQSFTILPNSTNSSALNTTANRLGINTANPNFELQINRNGAVNTFAQFTNNVSGRTANDGLLVGIDTVGRAIFNQRSSNPISFSLNNLERFRIEQPSLTIEGPPRLVLGNLGIDVINGNVSSGSACINQFQSQFGTSIIRAAAQSNLFSSAKSIEMMAYGPTAERIAGIDADDSGIIETESLLENLFFNVKSGSPNSKIIFSMENDVAMTITNNKKVGINDVANPLRTLDVNGDVRFGTNGTTITSFVTSTLSADLPTIQAGSFYTQDFTISGIVKGKNSVFISPDYDMGLMGISFAWVSENNIVAVRFHNQSNAPIDVPNMPFHLTIVTYP
ncbi:MAG: hypothetical protein MUF45_12420 [Spirosomaceae bacterium]|jgi:hypothetical protein|nr:hypothetical protein [Spirosomataceae bacterium]